MRASGQRAELLEQDATVTDDRAEILRGLRLPQKRLSPKFFYDKRGSALFEAICELPEYYPTRTELRIMRDHVPDMAGCIGPRASVIELGSGSSLKTRILLEQLHEPAAYIPVDISREHLLVAAESIAREFPRLQVLQVAADFTHPFPLPSPRVTPERHVVYFPGSTIGNFSPDEARDLLRVIHHEAGSGGAALIGIDLRKDREILRRAYNDNAGVTAAFNLNVLRRLNREFAANFDLDAFRHRAVWNDRKSRIEMHLVSRRRQTAQVAGHRFGFERDEYIVTEHSHKYTQRQFGEMAECAGFRVVDGWTDPREWFSIQYCITR